MKQEYDRYTSEDLIVWKTLFERQVENLKDKACKEYLDSLSEMSDVLNPNEIPNFQKLNNWFQSTTGWQMECVPGLIPVGDFFQLLAEKKFCSSTWLRRIDQLDYLEEPDMFHDIFGHVPLLSQPIFSSFMHEFGKLGVQFLHDEEKLIQLQRVYWFTIEFGLIQQNGLKIYGAGIASSFGESISSIQSEIEHISFDLNKVIEMVFKTDEIQTKYFVIVSFEQLFDSILQLNEKWKILELVVKK